MIKPHDGVLVQNISEKAKNPYPWSKNSLYKNFKLVLDQNGRNQTYTEISCRPQNWPLKICLFWTFAMKECKGSIVKLPKSNA